MFCFYHTNLACRLNHGVKTRQTAVDYAPSHPIICSFNCHLPFLRSRSPERRPTAEAWNSDEGFPPKWAGRARLGPEGSGGSGPWPPWPSKAPLLLGLALEAAVWERKCGKRWTPTVGPVRTFCCVWPHLHCAHVSFYHNKDSPSNKKQTLEVRQMLKLTFWRAQPLLYLNVLSVQHTAVHAVDSRREEAGRGQAAQGDGYDVTPLHRQHWHWWLLLCRDIEKNLKILAMFVSAL